MKRRGFIVFGICLVAAWLLQRHGAEAVWGGLATAAALFGFAVLVFIHELGHFLGGLLTGMAMPSFQVGFGKPLLSKLVGETEWKLCPIPLGGAVQFVGEDAGAAGNVLELAKTPGREALADERRWFHNASVGAQLLTLFMGPLFSILTAIPLFALCFAVWGAQDPDAPPIVASVLADLPAERAGILADDRIVRLDEKPVASTRELVDALQTAGPGHVHLVLERNGEPLALDLETVEHEGRVVAGLSFAMGIKRVSAVEALSLAGRTTMDMVVVQGKGLLQLVSGKVSTEGLSGPVGILKLSGESVRQGPEAFLVIMAVISIAVGVFNLLPIPILDGGRMVLTVLRAIVGKRAAKFYETPALLAGLAVILVILVLATLNDLRSL